MKTLLENAIIRAADRIKARRAQEAQAAEKTALENEAARIAALPLLEAAEIFRAEIRRAGPRSPLLSTGTFLGWFHRNHCSLFGNNR